MTRLSQSVDSVTALLRGADLAAAATVRELLTETTQRRTLDLSDLSPAEQSTLIAARSQELQPSPDALATRIIEADSKDRRFIAKFGIDPTGAEVHLGHAVPMLILSRFQRMGHQVVFIVGDMTAKIGDPSGRSDERPALTDEDIARNLATYREQVTPFFDFERAQFRHNGDWLRQITLPRIIVKLSTSLRDVFRRSISLIGSFSYCRSRQPEDFALALGLLSRNAALAARLVSKVGELPGLPAALSCRVTRSVRMALVVQPAC